MRALSLLHVPTSVLPFGVAGVFCVWTHGIVRHADQSREHGTPDRGRAPRLYRRPAAALGATRYDHAAAGADAVEAALLLAVERDWLLVEGGHSICLTDAGRHLADG